MSTAVAPLTVEQFLALPEEEGVRRELIEGEVVTMDWACLVTAVDDQVVLCHDR